ncbi:MAG TPA: hypothetical protein VG518_03195 [Solirubrobacterales bacterium]|nr:hypothetical protein [Solirubrobacterales bacterium]
MLSGDERKELLAVADQLSRELGFADTGEPLGGHSRIGADRSRIWKLDPADEALIERMRYGLAKIAAAAAAADSRAAHSETLGLALDFAETTIRGELVTGNAAELPMLLPSFVFLVAVSVVDRDRALELSRRAGELVAANRER